MARYPPVVNMDLDSLESAFFFPFCALSCSTTLRPSRTGSCRLRPTNRQTVVLCGAVCRRVLARRQRPPELQINPIGSANRADLACTLARMSCPVNPLRPPPVPAVSFPPSAPAAHPVRFSSVVEPSRATSAATRLRPPQDVVTACP